MHHDSYLQHLLWYWSLYFTNGSNALSPPAVSCCSRYGAHGRISHVLRTYEEYKKLFMNEYDLINHKMCDCHLNKTSWQLWQKIIHLHPCLLSSYMRYLWSTQHLRGHVFYPNHVTSWFDGTVVMNCQLRVSLDVVLGEVIINLKKLTSGNILHINLTTAAHCAEII